jgi:hypothetical protein
MKTSIPFFTLVFLALLLALTGCNKSNNDGTVAASDPAIDKLTASALAELGTQEVYAGLPETGLFMDNDGLPPVFVVDESDLDGDDPLREKIRIHSLIRCLKELDLREPQKDKVRVLLKYYYTCKEDAVKRARTIYYKLQAGYKEKYARIYRQYQEGKLSEREFKKLTEELRAAFKRELHELQLKEKVDQALIRCFRLLLSDLKSILTEIQWSAFTGCYIRGFSD